MNVLKNCILVFGLFLGWIGSQAQTAPDFTVTDIYGVEHALYEDHLQEGKVVVLCFFYDGAPMLSELLPLLQQYCVEQWEALLPIDALLLSHVDGDDALIQFAENHMISLPIAGPDGGADSAIAPYIDGTFGEFYGYPMFVIIGPKGEVIYDPWASTPEGMINVINDAVLSLLGLTTVEQVDQDVVLVYPQSHQLVVDLSQSVESAMQRFVVFDLSGKLLVETLVAPGTVQRFDLPVGIPLVYSIFGQKQGSGTVLLH